MFKWTQFPFIRLSVALIAGILLSEKLVLSEANQWCILLAFFLIFIILSKYNRLLTAGFMGLLVVAMIGFIRTRVHKQPVLKSNHITNIHEQPAYYDALVANYGSQRGNFARYELLLRKGFYPDSDSTIIVDGKIYLYLRSDSVAAFGPGQRIIIHSSIYEIDKPSNPGVFDYRRYLQNKGIYGQVFLNYSDVLVHGEERFGTLSYYSTQIRDYLSRLFDHRITEKREKEILKALTLGIKDSLDPQVKEAYAAAGIMHILAVSGLHVGILYLIISGLLSTLLKGKRQRYLRVGLIILFLFSFALVTGLTASVLRASVMFSIIACREIIGRKSSIYNSLGIAAFVLLLYNPIFIYDVGFQLSFIAVFGIVMLQPFIYQLWSPGLILLDKFWTVSSVSIAAQIATAPLSIYYFHQFPTYFLFTNLFAIPSAFFMLTGGMALWVLEILNIPFTAAYSNLLEGFVFYFNELVFSFEHLPVNQISDLYLESEEVALLLGFMLLLGTALYYRSFFTLATSLILFLIFSACLHYRNFETKNQQSLILYDIKGHFLMDWIRGNELVEFRNDTVNIDTEINYQAYPNRLAKQVRVVKNPPLPVTSIFQGIRFGSNMVLILKGNTNTLEGDRLHVSHIILTGMVSESLAEIRKLVDFRQLIISPDVPYWRARKWCEEASEMRIPYHDVSKDGFWMLDLS